MTQQEIITLVIVAITASWLLKRTWKKWSQAFKGNCSSCSGCFSTKKSCSLIKRD